MSGENFRKLNLESKNLDTKNLPTVWEQTAPVKEPLAKLTVK